MKKAIRMSPRPVQGNKSSWYQHFIPLWSHLKSNLFEKTVNFYTECHTFAISNGLFSKLNKIPLLVFLCCLKKPRRKFHLSRGRNLLLSINYLNIHAMKSSNNSSIENCRQNVGLKWLSVGHTLCTPQHHYGESYVFRVHFWVEIPL